MKNTSTISERDKAFTCRFNRNLVFSELIRFYALKAKKEGITQKKISDRLQKDYGQISRMLSEPRNLTLDSISLLLLAMDAEMKFQVVPQSKTISIDKLMERFDAYSSAERLTGTNIVRFESHQPKEAQPSYAATTTSVTSSFGVSHGQQAIG